MGHVGGARVRRWERLSLGPSRRIVALRARLSSDAPMTPDQLPRTPPSRTARLQLTRVVPLAVLVAIVTVPLLVPHPTAPRFLPLPLVEQPRLTELDARERSLAEASRTRLLPPSVRVVGELTRRVGAALAERSVSTEPLLRELREETAALLREERAEELLALRALQAQLFVEAVRDWEQKRRPSAALAELGGDFMRRAEECWLDETGQLPFSDAELRLLFRARWGRLSGTYRVAPFGPSLVELRAYYALYLRHPDVPRGSDAAALAVARLRYVETLGRLDRSYPAALARGVLLDAAGGSALAPLREHVSAQPSGPYARLALNHLLWAASREEP